MSNWIRLRDINQLVNLDKISEVYMSVRSPSQINFRLDDDHIYSEYFKTEEETHERFEYIMAKLGIGE